MEKLNVIVYSMKGCPFCNQFKDLLVKESIEFVERDIDEHKEEYDLYVKATKIDLVPALMIIEGDEEKHESFLYAPERDYNLLDEALDIVKKHKSKII